LRYQRFATQHGQLLAAGLRQWPSLLLLILLAFGWKSSWAQSSAGSLNCGAPRGGIPSSTATTTKKNSKVDQFNAIQQQEQKNQQAIQQGGDSILNGLKGSGKSDLKSDESADGNSDDSTPTETMEAPPPDANPSTDSPVDAVPPASNSAATVNSLLDDSSAPAALSNSAAAVNSLLGDSTTEAPQPSPEPAIPSLASIDTQENAEAQTLGSEWKNAFSSVEDETLSALKAAGPNALDAVAGAVLPNDPLKAGAAASIQSFLPQSSASEFTLGSPIQDTLVSIAGEKVADTLTDAKDEAVCSGQNSDLESRVCMVWMAPTNLVRGLFNFGYKYGKILVDRAGQMIDSAQAEFLPDQTQ
jgi:hypothetical protein